MLLKKKKHKKWKKGIMGPSLTASKKTKQGVPFYMEALLAEGYRGNVRNFLRKNILPRTL